VRAFPGHAEPSGQMRITTRKTPNPMTILC
jgi:hypothetical protein